MFAPSYVRYCCHAILTEVLSHHTRFVTHKSSWSCCHVILTRTLNGVLVFTSRSKWSCCDCLLSVFFYCFTHEAVPIVTLCHAFTDARLFTLKLITSIHLLYFLICSFRRGFFCVCFWRGGRGGGGCGNKQISCLLSAVEFTMFQRCYDNGNFKMAAIGHFYWFRNVLYFLNLKCFNKFSISHEESIMTRIFI